LRDVDDDQILDRRVDLFELISGLGTEAGKSTQPKGLRSCANLNVSSNEVLSLVSIGSNKQFFRCV
jgi:hypothetical protein